MKKFLFLFISVLLFARINPFKPVINVNSELIVKPEYFKEAKVMLPKDARVLKKIIFVYQSLSGDVKQKEIVINKHIDFHQPIYISHSPKIFPMRKLHFLNLFDMYIKNKKIFIKTDDKLLRNFFLVKPFRIVLDFKRNADFLTIKKVLKNYFIQKVVVGNHSGYYRVVIYLDAKYFYKVAKKDGGIEIDLK